MAFDPWTAGMELAGKVLDRVIPDPAQRAAAALEMAKVQQASELAQIATNTAEAASPSMFVAGWRPFVGWICGAGLGYEFLLRPLLAWVGGPLGMTVPPELPFGDLSTILMGMLGMGTLRTYEKVNGVATTAVATVASATSTAVAAVKQAFGRS